MLQLVTNCGLMLMVVCALIFVDRPCGRAVCIVQ